MSESAGSPGFTKPTHQYGQSFPGVQEQDELLGATAPELAEEWAGERFTERDEESST